MKRTVYVVLLFVLSAMILAACGGTPAAEAPAEPATEPEAVQEEASEEVVAEPEGETAVSETVKISIFVGLGTGTDPDQITAQEALADEFNSTHDDIQIEFLIVPNDEANERLLAMVAGGEAPELVGPGGVDVAGDYRDILADVQPLMDAEGFDTSDFYGAAVDLYAGEDKTVGIPLGMFPSFIFYNKDLFDAAGLDYPTTDYSDTSWNIDALRTLAMELTLDANGNNALSPDFDIENVVQWGYDDSWTDFRGAMTLFDPPQKGSPVSADFKTALVNSDEYKYGFNWLNNAIWVDGFMADYSGQEAFYATAGDPFGSELTAMFYSHTWFMPEGLVDLPFDYGFAPSPYNQKGTRVSRIHADTFYMLKDGKHPQEAFEVMKWLTSEEHIIDVCLIYGCLPARRSVADAYLEQLQARYGDHDYDVIINAIDYLDNPHHESWVPEPGRVGDMLAAELYDAVYTGKIEDTDALLEEVNGKVQTTLDEYWANQ